MSVFAARSADEINAFLTSLMGVDGLSERTLEVAEVLAWASPLATLATVKVAATSTKVERWRLLCHVPALSRPTASDVASDRT